MYQLEHGSDDRQKKKVAIPTLTELEEKNEVFKDDYILNMIARNKFRVGSISSKSSYQRRGLYFPRDHFQIGSLALQISWPVRGA